MQHLIAVENAARGDDGNVELDLFQPIHELRDHRFERKLLVVDLFDLGGPQMSAGGVGGFDDEGVGRSPVILHPASHDDRRGLEAADDGHERHVGKIPGQLGQLEGQPGAGDDDVDAGFADGAHLLLVILKRAHAVGGEDAAFRLFAGFGDEILEGFHVLFEKVVHVASHGRHADADGRQRADAALGRDGAAEAGAGDENAHASLDDGEARRVLTDFQCWQFVKNHAFLLSPRKGARGVPYAVRDGFINIGPFC